MMPWSHGRPRYGQPCGESAHTRLWFCVVLLDRDPLHNVGTPTVRNV